MPRGRVRVLECAERILEGLEGTEIGTVVVAYEVRGAVELDEAGEFAGTRRDVHIGVGLLPGQRI